jgi:hypothetical protein
MSTKESPMDTRIRHRRHAPDRRDSNIIWFAEECLNNGVQVESYVRAAEHRGDAQLADFFRRALAETSQVEHGDPRLGRLRHYARLAEFKPA